MNKQTAARFQNTNTDAVINLPTAAETEEQRAYDKMLPHATELAPSEVMQVNLDPSTACPIVIAVAERLVEQRDRLKKLSEFEISNLDTLRKSACALSQAHGAYVVAMAPSDMLPKLAERGTALLTKFEAWIPGLSLLGLVDAARFVGLRSPVGYRDMVTCLNAYRTAFQESDWSEVKKKSGLTDEDLADAGAIAIRMMEIVGRRDVSPENVAAMADVRARMFTLMFHRYDQMRRAAVYLCWGTNDADVLVPSLYPRGPRKTDNQPATNGQPGASGNASGTTPSTTVVHAAPAAAPASAPVTPHAASPASPASADIGMPGSSPFTTPA